MSDSKYNLNSDTKGEGGDRPAFLNYTDIFNKHFPFYLSIGMSADQYWNQDVRLVEAYRKADELRRKRINEEAWLQGMYIYDALQRLTPIFQAFPKKGAEPMKYVEEPYPLNNREVEKLEEKKDKGNYNKGKAYMESCMSKFNEKYKREE